MHRFRWKLVTPVHTARFLIIGTVAALGVGLGAAPAMAAPTADTDVTFLVTGGTLDIVAPADADLGPATASGAGVDITGEMGDVTVTDNRADLVAAWETTVSSTPFTTGAAAAAETIAANLVDYWSGPVTAGGTGAGTFTPGQPTVADADPLGPLADVDPGAPVVLEGPVTAFTHAGGVGNNTVTWTPTLIVNVPATAVGGAYTGTVTHSVA